MKLKDIKNEIKVLDITALIARAKALHIEINDLVLDKNINKLKNLKTISVKKKEVARVLTAMNQKKLIASLEPEKSPVETSSKGKNEEEKETKAKKGAVK